MIEGLLSKFSPISNLKNVQCSISIKKFIKMGIIIKKTISYFINKWLHKEIKYFVVSGNA
jgi:hypothetical protein